MKMKRLLLLILSLCAIFLCVACEKPQANKEETETEKIEILDATDILLKVWSNLKIENIEVMGGHYSDPAMGNPAKYDLSQVADLSLMYCVPEQFISQIDDASTMVDLYNAARFTAVSIHLTENSSQEQLVEAMKQQILQNEWHGESPEKILVIGIEDEYVVSVYGRKEIVDEFEKVLKKIYFK